MKRKNLIFTLGIIGLLFLSGCAAMDSDVQLARRIFKGMVSGSRRVQSLIDWEKLQAIGVDVGKSYSEVKSEKDRADYRKAFLFNLSFSFKSGGGKTSNFFNWREENKGADHTVVAADTGGAGRVILFTITHTNGKRKLTAINWQ
jgi:hypothetical protein